MTCWNGFSAKRYNVFYNKEHGLNSDDRSPRTCPASAGSMPGLPSARLADVVFLSELRSEAVHAAAFSFAMDADRHLSVQHHSSRDRFHCDKILARHKISAISGLDAEADRHHRADTHCFEHCRSDLVEHHLAPGASAVNDRRSPWKRIKQSGPLMPLTLSRLNLDNESAPLNVDSCGPFGYSKPTSKDRGHP